MQTFTQFQQNIFSAEKSAFLKIAAQVFEAGAFFNIFLKSDSQLPSKICFYESPLKMRKDAFYFILKVLFVIKIFKFLS